MRAEAEDQAGNAAPAESRASVRNCARQIIVGLLRKYRKVNQGEFTGAGPEPDADD